jgi:hypothetical protein
MSCGRQPATRHGKELDVKSGTAMGLVNLYNPPDPGQWSDMWWFNWNQHQDIVKAIKTRLSIKLTEYVIWPWMAENVNDLLYAHQLFHNEMNAALSLPNSSDLSVLDIEDPSQVTEWTFSHFQEHLAVNTVLKL